MRRFGWMFGIALSTLLPWSTSAVAQANWPTRPVTLVVGFAAGGPSGRPQLFMLIRKAPRRTHAAAIL